MGQKVHPYGFRLGYTKPWKSRWFVERDYDKLLLEDVIDTVLAFELVVAPRLQYQVVAEELLDCSACIALNLDPDTILNFGLLRVRQFLMKDAYSFDIDEAGLDVSYNKHDETYRRIFTRCGLEFVGVEADSGAMGGSQSQEFMVYTEAGEDLIVSCAESGYAANLEKAVSQLTPVTEMELRVPVVVEDVGAHQRS